MGSNKKRILVFVDWFEPGYRAGGPIRSVANIVDRLTEFDFDIVTRNNDHFDETPYENVSSGEWVARNERVRILYLTPGQRNKIFLDSVLNWDEYDLVYLNSLFSISFSINPLRWLKKTKFQGKIILAPRGMLKRGAMSIKSRKKSIFLLLSKLVGLFKNIIWHATNEEEKREIETHFGKNSIVHIAPNLLQIPDGKVSHPPKQPKQLKLISIARVSAEKGILEGLQFLESASLKGQVEYNIYGTLQDPEYLAACKIIADGLSNIEVNFHGPLPYYEVVPKLSEAHFFYLSTRGENFGHSIVEALLCSTPVIISDRTPWKNLAKLKAGWELPLDAQAFSPVLSECLDMNHETYSEWCDGAHDLGMGIARNEQDLEANCELFRY